MAYKSPVDGNPLVPLQNGSFRDRATGQIYSKEYVLENCEETREESKKSEAPAKPKAKSTAKKQEPAKARATKKPPTPKDNGKPADEDAPDATDQESPSEPES